MVKKYLIIIYLVSLPTCLSYAQEGIDAKDIGYYDETGSNARIPGRSIPTEYRKKINFDFSRDDLEVFVDTSAKSQIKGNENSTELTVRLGANWDHIDAQLQLNLMKAMHQNYLNNGLIDTTQPEFLEKLWLTWEAFKMTGSEDVWLAMSIQVGRNAVTPLGVFILPYRANMSIIDQQMQDQVEFISVNTQLMENTIIELVSFGHNIFGDREDDMRGRINDNFAVNLLHSLEHRSTVINLYLSYAKTKAGFSDPKHLIIPHTSSPEQNQFSQGVEFVMQNLSISIESNLVYDEHLNHHQTAYTIQVAYDIPQTSMTFFSVAEYFDSPFEAETGTIFSVGAKWKILENVFFIVEGSEAFHQDGDKDFSVFMGVLVE